MSQQENSQAIEVEVLAVDGIAPVHPQPRSRPAPSPADARWAAWRGRMLHLDRRWWPLWGVLGIIAVFLLLTVGLLLAVLFAIFRIVRGLLRALFR